MHQLELLELLSNSRKSYEAEVQFYTEYAKLSDEEQVQLFAGFISSLTPEQLSEVEAALREELGMEKGTPSAQVP
ncbi:hypothetical protein K9N68_10770 [Kovacikia minuta CCNUW1]|uniref:hypothetical protein n=1 Tax=Kovacikia minuta TaxID=2931930 RepID=UPI001CCDE03F|nr:hypothetical protein [Kovacikia minuta]UBF28312.1 hypothetical protein K9N68_10770 [Kovacikia minuta CCNUW1]